LVFASERTGQFELWRVELRDSQSTQVTFGALQPRRPAVRPDGNAVAYLESASLEPAAPAVVKVLELRRREESTVATKAVGATALAWAEDGRTLIVRASLRRARRGPRHPPRSRYRSAAGGRGERRVAAEDRVERAPLPHPTTSSRSAGYSTACAALITVTSTCTCVAGASQRSSPAASCRRLDPSLTRREATVILGSIDLHAHQSSLVGERLGRAWLAYGVDDRCASSAASPGEALERSEAWASGRSTGAALAGFTDRRGGTEREPCRSPPIRESRTGLAHSLRRQARETAVPPWELAAAAGTPARRHRYAGPRARACPQGSLHTKTA
jgi:hypothetical protein